MPIPAPCKRQDLSGSPPTPLPSHFLGGFDEKEGRDGGHERRPVEDKAGVLRIKENAAVAMAGVNR